MNIWAPHDNNYVFSIATKHDCFVESGNRTKSCFSPAAQSDFDTLSSDRSIDDVSLSPWLQLLYLAATYIYSDL